MFHARPHAALPTLAGVLCAVLFAAVGESRAQQPSSACDDQAEIAVLASPIAPWRGAPLRVMLAAEKPIEGELSLIGPDGKVAATTRERLGGPPYSWIAEVAKPAAGKWRASLTRSNAPSGCKPVTREIVVLDKAPARPGTSAGSVWPLRDTWNRSTENLYSAWIEKLFDAPQDQTLSWPALHEVLRDRSRNVLFNHMGLNEDSTKMVVRPDCADLPYFLRAYFAFKMGLPIGYAKCTRGSAKGPPVCTSWWNIQNLEPRATEPEEAEPAAATPTAEPKRPASNSPFDLFRPAAQPEPAPATKAKAGEPKAKPKAPRGPPPQPAGLVPSFGWYLRIIADGVHSGGGRTRLADENTDYYPVPLNQDALRPGTTYADPYGHLLVLVKRVSQTEGEAGVFLAVDAQPDGTVARKRFWRGNFLFAEDPVLGGPGFKRFRPIVRDKSGKLRRLSNAEIMKNPDYADFSLDQGKLGMEGFYDRMDDVMSPAPLDPLRAMAEAITSLEEQVKARITSVENGRKFQSGGREATMPDGAAIFETTGPWEDFSTPSRDLRLLIAIDVVRHFPERIARRPERYAMPAGKSVAQVKADLEKALASQLASRQFSYPRSDGSPWTLSIKNVVDRVGALEMAYNPNDCVELRWGAPDNSEEAATCKRAAPRAQRAKMTDYRPWFSERRRPPRG